MVSFTKEHFEILLHPSLSDKWFQALDFTSLRLILTKYFDVVTLNEIYHDPDKRVAVQKLHRKVLLSDNDSLYMDIVKFCKEKCRYILNFLELWIKSDNEENSSEESILLPRKRRRKQSNAMTKSHPVVNKKLKMCLNKKTIVDLMRKFNGQECGNDDVLLSRLLKSNNNDTFHDELYMYLHKQQKEYHDCHRFMEHGEQNNEELTTSSTSSASNLDLSLNQLQLEIGQLNNKVVELTNEMETKMKRQNEEVKRTRDECNAKIKGMREEMNNNNSLSKSPSQIYTPTHLLNLCVTIYRHGSSFVYPSKVFPSQTLFDLKRTICIARLNQVRPEEIKLVHLDKLLVNDNMTLYDHGLVKHSAITCLIKSQPNDVLIKVFVQDKDNQREEFHVDSIVCVLWLKAEYSERKGILLKNIKLFHKNKAMVNDLMSIQCYGVKDNSILIVSS